MMASKSSGHLLLAAAMGFAAVFLFIGLKDVSPALAQEQAGIESVHLSQPDVQPPSPGNFDITIYFTNSENIPVMDLSGNLIGAGKHGGEVRCQRNRCNKKTQLQMTSVYEYKYKDILSLIPADGSAVVAGVGNIISPGRSESFSFTATFQDNLDGTVLVVYAASISEASFVILRAPGWLQFRTIPGEGSETGSYTISPGNDAILSGSAPSSYKRLPQ